METFINSSAQNGGPANIQPPDGMVNGVKMKKMSLGGVSILAASATLTFGASVAHAEIEDSIDAALVDTSLTYLGLEEVTDQLSGFLEEGMDSATDAGLVPNELIDAVAGEGESALEGEQTPTEPSSEPAVLDPNLEQLFDEQLDLDQQRWDEAGPLWLAAFETIRAEFTTCREEGQSTSVCARTMAFSLQIAQADALLAELDERIVAIDTLPLEQQEQLRAELEAERVALESRLVRAEARLSSVAAPTGANSERVVALLATVRERAQTTRGAQGGASAQTGDSTLTEQVPANPGTSGQSGAPSQKLVTPNSGATPGGRPDSGSTPGSQGNRPQAPGSNAGNAGNNGAGR